MTRFAVRATGSEFLDAPSHDVDVLHHALHQVAGVNRWLGGDRAVLRYLDPVLDDAAPVSILDVGTGSADIPRRIARRAAARGRSVHIVALDSQPQVAACAQTECAGWSGVRVAVGRGERLPFATNSVDVAISSMTLHHLPDEAAVVFVREMARVARRAVIVNDLERHPINYVGARLLAATVWRRNRYTREDGPTSVLRSFRANELLAVGQRAGLAASAVHRSFPYRLVLLGRPSVSPP